MTDLTPVGRLLEDARKASDLSQNAAARAAGTTGTTWRNIIRGYAEHGGNRVPYSGKAQTVADMARAVGVPSHKIRAAGRPEVADLIQNAELKEKFAGQSTSSINERTKALVAGVKEMISEFEGRAPDEQEELIIESQLHGLVVTLAAFENHKKT